MIVKKIFYIFIFFPSFHIFSFIKDVEELDASKEDSQENFYENNKKEFNIKGHLSISSGALNCITLSGPLYRFIQPVLYFLVTCEWKFGNCGYKETCIFDEAIKKGYTWKGIPYQVFFWLFSCSLRYDYFFNKTIGFGVKFDIFGDHIKQPLSRASKEGNIEKATDKNSDYYFNLFQGQIFMNICYNKSGTNNKFLKTYIGGSLGLTLGFGVDNFIFECKNFCPTFSLQFTPVVIHKKNGLFFSFTCLNIFLNKFPFLKKGAFNKENGSRKDYTLFYLLFCAFALSLKINLGYSWTLGDKKVKVEEEL